MTKFCCLESLAGLYPHLDADPSFYEAKAKLRQEFPDAAMIEVVPGPWNRIEIFVVHAHFMVLQALI